MVISELRSACAEVARRAGHVRINEATIQAYAADLPAPEPQAAASVLTGSARDREAAFWLTLDAINFGSGWFPTLRKHSEPTGYRTIAAGVRRRFDSLGPWSPTELAAITATELAQTFGQDQDHKLMALFAASLQDLGRHIDTDAGGSFVALLDAAEHSALALVERLSTWDSFSDVSQYQELRLPFLKRAQIASADLNRAGVARFDDLRQLTLFADNLVPHVLRLDGILEFDTDLVKRIERGDLIAHDSPAEIEIRACALHAVELIVASRPPCSAAQVDQLLWNRGQGTAYKAVPRHRSRCTAY